MLVNFQQEVRNILIPIGHSFQSFDFIVNPLGDGSGDPLLEVVQDDMPLAEELHCKLPEGGNVRCKGGGDPLPKSGLGAFAGFRPIDFEKLFFE